MLLETFGYVLWRFLFMFLKVSPSGSFPPPLSREKEQALFCDMANGDQKARETLICHNLRLVAHIVKKYYPTATDQEELVSIGTIGLIKAIDTFDASKGARFATYAGRCVQNEILMHFRAQKKLGAEVVYPEWDMAIRLANRPGSNKYFGFCTTQRTDQHFQIAST